MILYSDKCTELTEFISEHQDTFSAILIKGDYGKGKSTLIRHVLDSFQNQIIMVTQYTGMTTLYEALYSALREICEKQAIDITNRNSENPFREYLKQLCIKVCRQTPNTILVFQDMKDYGEELIELIREIIIFMSNNSIPCCVLFEYSTNNLTFEQRDQLIEFGYLCHEKEIILNNENMNDYLEFISSLLIGENTLTQDQKLNIIKEAFYNPKLIQQMASYFIDTGIFYQEENLWKCDEIDFHMTAKLFENHIYKRYSKLDEELKATLDKASITGYKINQQLLYHPLGIIKSEENLRRIERVSRLITHTENSYEFENNTVYNLISDKVGSSERKALHLLVAEYLFTHFQDYTSIYSKQVLFHSIKTHYLYAEHIDEALYILGCYIQQAYLERNYDAVLNGIEEFLKLSAGKFPYAEQQLIIKRMKVYQLLGEFSQAYNQLTFTKLKYLPLNSENWIEYWKAYTLFHIGKTREAREIADALMNKLDKNLIKDEYLLLKLDILLSGMYHHFGNVAYASKRYEQGMAISSRKLIYEKEYNYLLSISNMFLTAEFAVISIMNSMRYFKSKHFLFSYAKAANNAAISYIYLGAYEKAVSLLGESTNIFSDACSASIYYPTNNLGTIYALMNKYDVAIDYFMKALDNPMEEFSVLWITINMSHCKRKLHDFYGCEMLLNEVEQRISKMSANTSLLKRNYHIARTLLHIDKEEYQEAYNDCLCAIEIEINDLKNDTYPIYITKVLISITTKLEMTLPEIAIPYKSGRESEHCKDLLNANIHLGNFLFWEI